MFALAHRFRPAHNGMVDSAQVMRERDEPELDEYNELSDENHPDFDLSEWGLRWDSEPDPKPWFMRRGVLLLVAALVITSLLLPPLIIIF